MDLSTRKQKWGSRLVGVGISLEHGGLVFLWLTALRVSPYHCWGYIAMIAGIILAFIGAYLMIWEYKKRTPGNGQKSILVGLRRKNIRLAAVVIAAKKVFIPPFLRQENLSISAFAAKN